MKEGMEEGFILLTTDVSGIFPTSDIRTNKVSRKRAGTASIITIFRLMS